MSEPTSTGETTDVVEIKPEVVFLYEILQELTRGFIQIPRFQRAFVWRPDQMTELLDSINRQYPIGSLLVWETSEELATLDNLGPFEPIDSHKPSSGYLLDGHQRLMTLAGALLPNSSGLKRRLDSDGGKWEMFWNVRDRRFQHRGRQSSAEVLFPMTALLDTVEFFAEIDKLRDAMGAEANAFVNDVSVLARTFQSYRVPVIRIRQTSISEAVEIFARLNSRGQSMTPDQMVSALTFRQAEPGSTFDLATEIDRMVELLAERRFAELDRQTILRAILANLDEDIYRTDWTRLARDKRADLQGRLDLAVRNTNTSLSLAIEFLNTIGVTTGRLLPYGLQLVLLSAFFDRCPQPSDKQLEILRRWFWVSSFSAWFGGANPSRISALVREFRNELAQEAAPTRLMTFDLSAESLPFPTNFDMRSARTRALLLVMLDADPSEAGRSYREHATNQLALKGPAAVGNVFWTLPERLRGNPANRIFRPPSHERGALAAWVAGISAIGDHEAMARAAVSDTAAQAVVEGDVDRFILERQSALIGLETEFQSRNSVTPSAGEPVDAPVDTD